MTHAEIPEGTAEMTARHFWETYSLAIGHAIDMLDIERKHPDVLDSKPASEALNRARVHLERLRSSVTPEAPDAVR